jgi:predicted TIM-barrel fold metal-dependent hydrolase
MVLAGTLDRHPQLRIVIGHMGEMLYEYEYTPAFATRLLRVRYNGPRRHRTAKQSNELAAF